MDVGLAAHRHRVAEPLGDDGEQRGGVAAGHRRRLVATVPQRQREDTAVPGAKVLGGEVATGRFAQVVVHVAGIDTVDRALRILVLEQRLPRQRLALAHDAGDAPVVDRGLVQHAALAAELQTQLVPPERDVARTQRRQTERSVLAGVLVVADADERGVEQPHDRRQHCGAFEVPTERRVEVAPDAAANPRQRLAEGVHPVELRRVARATPVGVIPVLLATARVAPGRLQVPLRMRTDPDFPVSRRNGEPPNAVEVRRVGELAAVGLQVDEAFAAALAPVAGGFVGNIDEARRELVLSPLGRPFQGGYVDTGGREIGGSRTGSGAAGGTGSPTGVIGSPSGVTGSGGGPGGTGVMGSGGVS